MIYDAIVLAGGRSSRLDGYAKASVQINGRTVLDLTLEAVGTARHVTVVGDVAIEPPGHVSVTREDPPFGGPVAGIAAGVHELDRYEDSAAAVMVLACDMPRISSAVPVLLAAAAGSQALVARDGDRDQYLVARIDGITLRTALSHLVAQSSRTEGDGLVGASVRKLWATTGWRTVVVPAGSTRDIDTWDDARELGADLRPDPHTTQPRSS